MQYSYFSMWSQSLQVIAKPNLIVDILSEAKTNACQTGSPEK